MTRHGIISGIVFIIVAALTYFPAVVIIFVLSFWLQYLSTEQDGSFVLVMGLCALSGFLVARRVYRSLDPDRQPEVLPTEPRWRHVRRRFGIGLAICAILVAMPFGWSLFNPYIVEANAIALAADAPYCLQVGTEKSNYKPLENWWEMTGFALQTPWSNNGGSKDYQFTFHAILVISHGNIPELYNWSFRSQNFLPISLATQGSMYLPITCVPARDFLDNLPEPLT